MNKDFGNRLKSIRKELKLTQKEISDKLGIPAHKIKDLETGKQKASVELCEALEENFSINGWWLLTGKNKMFLENNNSIEENTYQIDILSTKASAGFGNEHYIVNTIGKLEVDKILFKTIPKLEDTIAIEVDGDSMFPTLSSGDFVIVQECIDFQKDGLYVLNINNNLYVKRLQQMINGQIAIISDNKLYEPLFFNPNENQEYFNILGKVVVEIKKTI